MPYEILEHTADAKFRAYGKTRDEAFSSAVQGLTAIIVDPMKLSRDRVYVVSVKSSKLDRLLFDFMDEILFIMDTEKFIPAAALDLKITGCDGNFVLETRLCGDDLQKWPGNLKAVTYSDMICEKQEDGTWLLQVVIDI